MLNHTIKSIKITHNSPLDASKKVFHTRMSEKVYPACTGCVGGFWSRGVGILALLAEKSEGGGEIGDRTQNAKRKTQN